MTLFLLGLLLGFGASSALRGLARWRAESLRRAALETAMAKHLGRKS